MKKRDLQKAIENLQAISAHRGGASELTEICRRLGIDLGRVLRILKDHATEIKISK